MYLLQVFGGGGGGSKGSNLPPERDFAPPPPRDGLCSILFPSHTPSILEVLIFPLHFFLEKSLVMHSPSLVDFW